METRGKPRHDKPFVSSGLTPRDCRFTTFAGLSGQRLLKQLALGVYYLHVRFPGYGSLHGVRRLPTWPLCTLYVVCDQRKRMILSFDAIALLVQVIAIAVVYKASPRTRTEQLYCHKPLTCLYIRTDHTTSLLPPRPTCPKSPATKPSVATSRNFSSRYHINA